MSKLGGVEVTTMLENSNKKKFEIKKLNKCPKAVLFYIHGYASSVSFANSVVSKSFCSHNYTVYAMDGFGHGLSDGLHGFIPKFDKYTDYFEKVYNKISEDYRDCKKYLLSVSMGGAVAINILAKKHNFDGIVFISPMIKIAPKIIPGYAVQQVFKLVSFLLPTSKLTPSGMKTSDIFNDQKFAKICLFL
ncbi:hypothetical protein MHBO_003503 [Bonamia ostreae]